MKIKIKHRKKYSAYLQTFIILSSFLLSILLVMNPVSAGAIYAEDFDDDTPGTTPSDDWYDLYLKDGENNGVHIVSADNPLSGTNSWKLYFSSAASYKPIFNITTPGTPMYVNFSIYINQTLDSDTKGFMIHGYTDKREPTDADRLFYTYIGQANNATICYSDGTWHNSRIDVEVNKWCNLSYRINYTDDTFQIANDAESSLWHPFRETQVGETLNQVMFEFKANTQVTIDNFHVTGYEETGSAPVNSEPSPANEAIDQALNPTLHITVNDADGDNMNVSFYTNATGSWGLIGYNATSANGTYYQSNSSMSALDTRYFWSVNTSDGNGNWDNDTYEFTTTATSDNPVNSDPHPADGATNQTFNFNEFNVTVNEPQGDTMDVYLWTNVTGSWVNWKSTEGVTNGTCRWIGSHDPYFTNLDPNTTYFWSVNTTDSEGNWDNDTYSFTTNHTYSMTITKTANVSTVETNDSVQDTQLVNYTINVTNTGTGDLTDISINETWWNCSCSDWKYWFIATNEPNWESNLTIYTDACYMNINITNLSAGESYELYILLNVSECVNDTPVSTLRNWANVTATFATPKSSHCDIQWGVSPPVEPLDVDGLATIIFTFIVMLFTISLIGVFTGWFGKVMR